jgi:hypothetical protein
MSKQTYVNALDRLIQPFLTVAFADAQTDIPTPVKDCVFQLDGFTEQKVLFKGECVYHRVWETNFAEQSGCTKILRPGDWIYSLTKVFGQRVLDAQIGEIQFELGRASDLGRAFAPADLVSSHPVLQ